MQPPRRGEWHTSFARVLFACAHGALTERSERLAHAARRRAHDVHRVWRLGDQASERGRGGDAQAGCERPHLVRALPDRPAIVLDLLRAGCVRIAVGLPRVGAQVRPRPDAPRALRVPHD
eukprot:3169757-Prymnesium_polylepis.1